MFAMNNKDNLLPNIWCSCSIYLDPNNIFINDQHVSFSLLENKKTLYIYAVYASTYFMKRIQLWNNLNVLQTQFVYP